MTVLCEIDGLDIVAASVARFDAHMREAIGSVDGQLLYRLFATCRAHDTPDAPLRRAEGTDQRSLGAVSFLSLIHISESNPQF